MYWKGFWILFAIYFVIRSMFGRSWKLRSDLMGGLLSKGDHVFVRFSMGFPFPILGFRLTSGRTLQRGDIVLFRSRNYEGGDEALVGVVAAVPGECVSMRDGVLSIDNKTVEGPWDSQEFAQEGKADKFGRAKGKEYSDVPDGHVYILSSDGQAHSDSRVLGWVSRGEIIGTVSRVWWPTKRARKVVEANPVD
jgi:signal peptidase I